jgi:hypothetical protein
MTEHNFIQKPIEMDQPLPSGARMAGCSCNGAMSGVDSAEEALDRHESHLLHEEVSPQETERSLEKARQDLGLER